MPRWRGGGQNFAFFSLSRLHFRCRVKPVQRELPKCTLEGRPPPGPPSAGPHPDQPDPDRPQLASVPFCSQVFKIEFLWGLNFVTISQNILQKKCLGTVSGSTPLKHLFYLFWVFSFSFQLFFLICRSSSFFLVFIFHLISFALL